MSTLSECFQAGVREGMQESMSRMGEVTSEGDSTTASGEISLAERFREGMREISTDVDECLEFKSTVIAELDGSAAWRWRVYECELSYRGRWDNLCLSIALESLGNDPMAQRERKVLLNRQIVRIEEAELLSKLIACAVEKSRKTARRYGLSLMRGDDDGLAIAPNAFEENTDVLDANLQDSRKAVEEVELNARPLADL